MDSTTINIIAGTALIFLLVIFIIIFVNLYSKAQLKFKLERQQLQEALLQTEIEIREQTLSNVSRELHDNLGQIAALVKINLNQLSNTLAAAEQVKLKSSTELVQQMITDIKGISSSLINNQLSQLGLSTAIQQDCERINKLALVEIQFIDTAQSFEFDNTSAIFLYRMYQEAINNVLSHSKASKAKVELLESPSGIQLHISDNGVGFTHSTQSAGNGLKNLKERCQMIGATLRINSSPSHGTEININYPI